MAGHRRRRRRLRRRAATSTSPTCAPSSTRPATASPAIMVTYPSTHGVFEEAIGEICAARPRRRRPGVRRRRQPQRPRRAGPARARSAPTSATSTCTRRSASRTAAAAPASARSPCAQHLAPFLPGDPLGGADQPVGPVSAAPFGSAGILPIPWAYIALMGRDGLRRATAVAILAPTTSPPGSATHYPVLYTRRQRPRRPRVHPRPAADHQGHRRHRRRRRQAADGLRLPRPDDELPGGRHADGRADRERDAGRARPLLRRDDRHPRARSIGSPPASGRSSESPLRHAPHTAEDLLGDWDRPYSREVGAYPVRVAAGRQVLPAGVADRRRLRRPQPVCSCEPLEAYADRQLRADRR